MPHMLDIHAYDARDQVMRYDRPDTPEQTQLEAFVAKYLTLGTAHDIALHLAGMQIRALCGNTNRCAMAEAVKRELDLGPELDVMVVSRSVWIYNQDDVASVGHMRAPVAMYAWPAVISEFIERFDDHEYPELMGATSYAWGDG